jgi:hypothetical protein
MVQHIPKEQTTFLKMRLYKNGLYSLKGKKAASHIRSTAANKHTKIRYRTSKDAGVLPDLELNPNIKALYMRIKDVRSAMDVLMKGNNENLNGFTNEGGLIELMRKGNDEKYALKRDKSYKLNKACTRCKNVRDGSYFNKARHKCDGLCQWCRN